MLTNKLLHIKPLNEKNTLDSTNNNIKIALPRKKELGLDYRIKLTLKEISKEILSLSKGFPSLLKGDKIGRAHV